RRNVGKARDAAMMDSSAKMVQIAPALRWDLIPSFLSAREAGKRLAAYTQLYVAPGKDALNDLVTTLTSNLEESHFGQYWGILALGRIVQENPSMVTLEILKQLTLFLNGLPKDTARYAELSRILGEFSKDLSQASAGVQGAR